MSLAYGSLQGPSDDFTSSLARQRHPVIVYVFVLVASLCNALYGYELAVIAQAKIDAAGSLHIVLESATYAMISGAMALGGTLGVILVGFLQDRIGRRFTLVCSCFFYIGSALVSHFASSWQMLAAGRFLTGVALGASSSTAPMFIGELAPPALRGALVTVNQTMICLGSLIGFGASKLLTPDWRTCFIAGTPLAGVLILALLFITPFSPRWLIMKGRVEEARAVLVRIRPAGADVNSEVETIIASVEAVRGVRLIAAMQERHVAWAVAIGVIAATMQQFCGVSAVNTFAPDIFATAGFDASDAITQSVILGAAKLTFVLVALVLMDRAGRRLLLLIGCAGMTASLMALALILKFAPSPVPRPFGYAATGSLVGFFASFEISFGPVLWVLLAELFPLHVKAAGMAIGTGFAWFFGWAVTQAFPAMEDGMGIPAVWGFFAGCCVLSFIWIARYLPETRGRSLEEVQEVLKGTVSPSKHPSAASKRDSIAPAAIIDAVDSESVALLAER